MKNCEPNVRQLDAWQQQLLSSGKKRISARRLLRTFGIKRRSQKSNDRVITWLESQIPPIFTSDLGYLRSLDETVVLTLIKLKRIGEYAETEKSLMARFEADIMPHLGLEHPRKHYPPHGSQDKLDFLCDDRQGRSVVVEIKKRDGEKRVVEQVLRYIRHLRHDPDCRDPRGIIVTGFEDPHTRRALEELEASYHIDWFIYGLDPNNKILIESVPVKSSRS